METLAYTHAAVDYEELNSFSELSAFRNIKIKALKAVRSIAIALGFMTAGVAASTSAQAETVNTTLSYGDTGSGVATLQSKLGGIAVDGIFGSQTLSKLKSYQAAHGLAVNGKATKETLASLELHNLTQAPLQYGKLKLVNDNPHEVIIFIYKPGEEKYSRYAYLPGCSQRILQSTYSNRWQVSLDLEKKVLIRNLKGDSFEFKASTLNEDKYASCPGQPQANGTKPTAVLAASVEELPKYYTEINIFTTTIPHADDFVRNSVKYATKLANASKNLGDDVAKNLPKQFKTLTLKEEGAKYLDDIMKAKRLTDSSEVAQQKMILFREALEKKDKDLAKQILIDCGIMNDYNALIFVERLIPYFAPPENYTPLSQPQGSITSVSYNSTTSNTSGGFKKQVPQLDMNKYCIRSFETPSTIQQESVVF